jgi:hypothetical protein
MASLPSRAVMTSIPQLVQWRRDDFPHDLIIVSDQGLDSVSLRSLRQAQQQFFHA